MSFDFFNQQAQPSLSFSPSENAYLARLLPFLDPQNTHTVSARLAIELLNRSGLPNQTIKEIWQVVNPQYKQSLSYEDVQSIIRLVAYGQTGVPISHENLELNISCNAPMFEFETQTISQSQRSQQSKQGISQQDMAAFERTWTGLEGKHNSDFIGGSAVKKLYQTEANKENLSKAWKMCSIAQKGYLTKGELFVFLHLIGLSKHRQELPAELTPEMKAIIAKFDSKIKNLPQQRPAATKQSGPPPASVDQPARLLLQAEKNNLEQFAAVADNENKFANLVDWLGRYIEESQQNNANIQNEMERIKTSQLQTFERLNGSIIKLQRVIQRQNAIIQDLTRQLRSRDAADQEKIRMVQNINEKSIPPPSAVISRPREPPVDKKPSVEQSDPADSPLYQFQLQALNLLNHIRPITPEELPSIQKRIVSMSQEQLRQFYAEVSKKYQQQQQQQREREKQKQQQKARPSILGSSSQFEPSSSNIIGNIEINPGGLGFGLDNSKVEQQNFDFATNVLMNLQVPEPPPASSSDNPFF